MKDAAPVSRSLDKFVVRLPGGMRERIAEAAEKSGRSMNAEIVQRLEESFDLPAKIRERDDVIAELRASVAAAPDGDIWASMSEELARFTALNDRYARMAGHPSVSDQARSLVNRQRESGQALAEKLSTVAKGKPKK